MGAGKDMQDPLVQILHCADEQPPRTEVIPKVTQQVGMAGRPDLQMPRWVYLYLLGLSFGLIHH